MSTPESPHHSADSPRENTAVRLHERRHLSAPLSDAEVRASMSRRSRRAFLTGGVAAVLGFFGYRWLRRPGQSYVFRRAFRFNEKLSQTTFSRHELAPEFPRNRIQNLRVNGTEGLASAFDPALWKLQVSGLTNPQSFPNFSHQLVYAASAGDAEMERKFPSAAVPGVTVTLDEIKALPRVEMTTELKCIEGWSAIMNWTGARFSDFAARYAPACKYVSLVTPDRGYYVGWDLPSLLHPQTLLCYEMNGSPLPLPHGGPLRLVTTAKYGIKQIKRIGRITFTNERPPDYWAERGYDWYSGL